MLIKSSKMANIVRKEVEEGLFTFSFVSLKIEKNQITLRKKQQNEEAVEEDSLNEMK